LHAARCAQKVLDPADIVREAMFHNRKINDAYFRTVEAKSLFTESRKSEVPGKYLEPVPLLPSELS
jgi:hypothetical protein